MLSLSMRSLHLFCSHRAHAGVEQANRLSKPTYFGVPLSRYRGLWITVAYLRFHSFHSKMRMFTSQSGNAYFDTIIIFVLQNLNNLIFISVVTFFVFAKFVHTNFTRYIDLYIDSSYSDNSTENITVAGLEQKRRT